MATRSLIGIENADGSVRSIYCHWDGHPDSAGAILAENYSTPEAAEALLALGNLSELGENPETCSAYYRDWDRRWAQNRPESYVDAEHYREGNVAARAIDYLYLFREGAWRGIRTGSGRGDGSWRRLAPGSGTGG